TWTETGVKWTSKPAIDGVALDSVLTPVVQGQNVDFHVTAGMTGDGSYNFGLTSASSNAVKYDSRESTTGPKLIVTFRQPEVRRLPTVTITAPADQASLFDDAPVTLTATASDAQAGDLTRPITRTSTNHGPLRPRRP